MPRPTPPPAQPRTPAVLLALALLATALTGLGNSRERVGAGGALDAAAAAGLSDEEADPLGPAMLRRTAGVPVLSSHSILLAADPATGIATVASPAGRVLTTFPLSAVVGATAAGPRRVHLGRERDGLEALTFDGAGREVTRATVRVTSTAVTVSFAALPGPEPAAGAHFFWDGRRGLDLSGVTGTYTPDAVQQAAGRPAIDAGVRTPLAPPPLDVELRTGAGWLGVGLADVPDARSLRVTAGGAVDIDYALDALARAPASDAGGRCGAMICFPRFVLTAAADPYAGLRTYAGALAELGVAHPLGGSLRPDWWQEPIADTWGQQMAEGAERGSPRFTAAWVQHFADTWRSAYGVRAPTIVIDSRWQQRIGDPTPDLTRFGGVAGMQALIRRLHAQGAHVLLWWPMWMSDPPQVPPTHAQVLRAGGASIVDPTAPGFEAAMRSTVERLLGSGPDDLGADGLKLDWEYDIPLRLADPAQCSGLAALLRSLTAIHAAAHALRTDALVDSSAAAPQFDAATDAVRLYDAWGERQWEERARVVASADPGMLIDGDGWNVAPAAALAHALASTVYGVPAEYFASSWTSGAPLLPAEAETIGAVISLAPLKSWGVASWEGGDWVYRVDGALRARTIAGSGGIVVWSPGPAGTVVGHVVLAGAGWVVIPVAGVAGSRVADVRGQPVRWSAVRGGIRVAGRAGLVLTVTTRGRPL